ncbi:MAG: hemin uptake protein HemP [Reyranella sp.]|nr:MAG: hemin uptake protein HemP [Reyranella sp.]
MDTLQLSPRSNAGAPVSLDTSPATPRIESTELMRGGREILIRHGEATYRLRVTMSDKLILTK